MIQSEWHIVKADDTAKQRDFAAVYDQYADKIYSFIYFKTCHRETAEDLTAGTFLKALDNWRKYDPARGSMSTWLYCIARNLVTDFYRKKQHTVAIHDIWDLAGEEDLLPDLHLKQQLAEIQRVMQQLPAEQREILSMRIWQDMPYKEIAAVLGKSEAACKMSFSRTIATLRKLMAATALVLLYLFKFIIQ